MHDLASIHASIWPRLARAADEPRDPFHTPVVATRSGDDVEARTIILRRVLADGRRLIFHTDARSPKVAEIVRHPRIVWVFYDPAEKVQLRVRSRAQVHVGDELARAQWSGATRWSRRAYLAPRPPSAAADELTHNLPGDLLRREPTEDELAEASANFAVVDCRVVTIDWLWLAREGHQRARFTCAADGVESTWLEP